MPSQKSSSHFNPPHAPIVLIPDLAVRAYSGGFYVMVPVELSKCF